MRLLAKVEGTNDIERIKRCMEAGISWRQFFHLRIFVIRVSCLLGGNEHVGRVGAREHTGSYEHQQHEPAERPPRFVPVADGEIEKPTTDPTQEAEMAALAQVLLLGDRNLRDLMLMADPPQDGD